MAASKPPEIPAATTRRVSRSKKRVVLIAAAIVTTLLLITGLWSMTLWNRSDKTPTGIGIVTQIQDLHGWRLNLEYGSAKVPWGDLVIELSDGTNATSWNNVTSANLTSQWPPADWQWPGKSLGELTIFLLITDMAGDGKTGEGDYLMFLTYASPTWSTTGSYTLALVHTPTGGTYLSTSLTS